MAQPQPQYVTAPPANMNPRKAGVYANSLSVQACEADDPAIMAQAISLASQAEPRWTREETINRGLKRAATRNALRVLRYLLDHGADVNTLRGGDLLTLETCQNPSRELLDIVAAYGWDPNPKKDLHGQWSRALLWLVVDDIELVQWCLDHGADVTNPDPADVVHQDGSETRYTPGRETVLGAAAKKGTIATFELLRSKGAPLDSRTLHLAVEKQRWDMVGHLIEVVGLDVNADARCPSSIYHSCSTALCITAMRRGSNWGFRPLVTYLLDHGADPGLHYGEGKERFRSAIECAEVSGNTDFLQILTEWREKKQRADTIV